MSLRVKSTTLALDVSALHHRNMMLHVRCMARSGQIVGCRERTKVRKRAKPGGQQSTRVRAVDNDKRHQRVRKKNIESIGLIVKDLNPASKFRSSEIRN